MPSRPRSSGETPENKPPEDDLFGPLPSAAPLPRTLQRVVDASAGILQDPPEKADFLHAVLCQVGMPRRQTADRSFERQSGAAMLRIEAGVLYNGKKFVDQPLPYGAKPRLIMVHIGTEAVRTKSREIEIGHSAHEFMQTLGFDTNSRSYSMVKKQIMALAACRMTLGVANGQRARTINTQPIEQFDAWLHQTGQQRSMWPGNIVLSETFFNTMTEFAVPLDHRALFAIKHSALALDIYSWLAHRLCRVSKPSGVMVSWGNLREQFGQEYSTSRDFKKEFRQALLQVRAVYPDARVEDAIGGFMLKSSPPPIRKAQILVGQGERAKQ